MTDKMIFKKHYFDVISFLPADERCEVYDALFAYHFFDVQPDLSGTPNDVLDMLLKMSEKREIKKREKREIKYPNESECTAYFQQNGYSTVAGQRFYSFYSALGWKDSRGNKVLDWKGKARSVWFTPENQMVRPQQKVIQTISEEDKRY